MDQSSKSEQEEIAKPAQMQKKKSMMKKMNFQLETDKINTEYQKNKTFDQSNGYFGKEDEEDQNIAESNIEESKQTWKGKAIKDDCNPQMYPSGGKAKFSSLPGAPYILIEGPEPSQDLSYKLVHRNL